MWRYHPQSFEFTLKARLEVPRQMFLSFSMPARCSLPYPRWIIRTIVRCSRLCIVQNPFHSGLRTLPETAALIMTKLMCSYRVAHIARAQRALQSSSKTSLRIGSDGTMNMQFLVPSPLVRGGNNDAFISFRVKQLVHSTDCD